jgi:hypothetical protein
MAGIKRRVVVNMINYIVCDLDGAIWGVGSTRREAVADFQLNHGDEDPIYDWDKNCVFRNRDTLVVCKASSRLAVVLASTLSVRCKIKNGIADLKEESDVS